MWDKPWQRAAFIALVGFFFYCAINVPIVADGINLINEGQGSLILPLALPFQFIFAPLLLMLRTRSRKQRIALNLGFLIAFLMFFFRGPSPGPRLEVPLGFVECTGDTMGWGLNSAETKMEMGEEVLSPSWFRFDLLSEGSSLRCRQFGSLEDARSDIGSLGEAIVDYVDTVAESHSYPLRFGEGAASVEINLSISSRFPPGDSVICKYEK